MLNHIILGAYEGQSYAFFKHKQQTIYRSPGSVNLFAPHNEHVYSYRFGPFNGDIYKKFYGYESADEIGSYMYIHSNVEDVTVLWDMLEKYISNQNQNARFLNAALYFVRSRKIDSLTP